MKGSVGKILRSSGRKFSSTGSSSSSKVAMTLTEMEKEISRLDMETVRLKEISDKTGGDEDLAAYLKVMTQAAELKATKAVRDADNASAVVEAAETAAEEAEAEANTPK